MVLTLPMPRKICPEPSVEGDSDIIRLLIIIIVHWLAESPQLTNQLCKIIRFVPSLLHPMMWQILLDGCPS